jgi:nucleotide-binding universal stress UspA family protein
MVAQAGVPEPTGYENARHGAPEHRRPPKALAHPVLGDPSQACEGALGHHGPENGPFGGGLKQDRGSHRFTQAEDLPAAGRVQPAGPLDHIPALDDAIGYGRAAAIAVAAAIGQEHGIPLLEEHRREAESRGARVADAMQNHHATAVAEGGAEEPGDQPGAARRAHAHGLQTWPLRHRPPGWVQGVLAQERPTDPGHGSHTGHDTRRTPNERFPEGAHTLPYEPFRPHVSWCTLCRCQTTTRTPRCGCPEQW